LPSLRPSTFGSVEATGSCKSRTASRRRFAASSRATESYFIRDRRVPRQRQAAILHGNRCRERRRSLSSRHGRRILPVPSTQSNRRGSDPYARWWGRGGIARCPPIPIVDPKPPFAAREISAARVQVFGPLVRKTASGLLHLQKKPTHAFSSRLSSFRKRQSVFSAMIFCGVDLMNPTSCSRRA